MQPGPGQEVGCLLEMVKSHYHKAGPRMTESQRTEQTKRLLASLPEGTSLSEQMLRMATELQLVETIPVSPMGPATDFVGVNMYVDDQAQAKGLPLNPRASSILATCRCPHQVFGDAFIARLQDNEAADVFKRMDFRLSELNSSSEWIRQAQQLNDPQGLRAQAGGREAGRTRSSGLSAPPPPGAGGAGAASGLGEFLSAVVGGVEQILEENSTSTAFALPRQLADDSEAGVDPVHSLSPFPEGENPHALVCTGLSWSSTGQALAVSFQDFVRPFRQFHGEIEHGTLAWRKIGDAVVHDHEFPEFRVPGELAHRRAVGMVCCHPTRHDVLTASHDGTAKLWTPDAPA